MPEIKKILFPIDFSESTNKLLPYVITFAQKFTSTIHLLYVVRDLNYLSGFHVPHTSLLGMEEEIVRSATKKMEVIIEEDLKGYPDVVTKVKVGDAANEIITYAKEQGIDLILMGTHGRKGLEHALFGSVAERVVKNSPVPVLTVNPYKV